MKELLLERVRQQKSKHDFFSFYEPPKITKTYLKEDIEFASEYMKHDPVYASHNTNPNFFEDKKFLSNVIKSFQYSPLWITQDIFNKFPQKLKENKNFNLKLTKELPSVYPYLEEEFRNDEEILLQVMKNNLNFFEFASEKLKANKNFIMKNFDFLPFIYDHLPKILKLDEEISL